MNNLKVISTDELRNRVIMVVGTRPGIIMFSPIIRAFEKIGVPFEIIHTGQHYSYNMDKIFFEELNIPKPRFHLHDVAEKKLHGAQTAAMLAGIERVLLEEKPKVVLVGGDANTNLSGALAARKLHIAVGHIEAGERSYDWKMPEEHNRRIIDHISEYLFATNEKGAEHLKVERVMGEIFVTGNTIVDAAYQNLEIALAQGVSIKGLGIEGEKGYCLLTSHREENVDNKENLTGILRGVEQVYEETGLPVFFAAHPRTLNRLEIFGMIDWAKSIRGLMISDAPGYLDFLYLLAHTKLVLTDSGGVQQEACILKVPCVTLRENTEWTETIEIGANQLAGTDPGRILEATKTMLKASRNWVTPFGDGKAAERIVDIIKGECLKA